MTTRCKIAHFQVWTQVGRSCDAMRVNANQQSNAFGCQRRACPVHMNNARHSMHTFIELLFRHKKPAGSGFGACAAALRSSVRLLQRIVQQKANKPRGYEAIAK